jgi:hypothetical protein
MTNDQIERTARIRARAYAISLLRPVSAPEADWLEAEREIEQDEHRRAGLREANSQFIPFEPNVAGSKG